VPFLGAVPLDPRIAKCCDFGQSFVDEFPDSAATKAFLSIVDRMSFCFCKLMIGVRNELGYEDNVMAD
jgi:hypothetical protein